MAQRATSLGPKPSLFIFFCFFCFVFVFFLCLFLICFKIGKPCFPPKKGNFCLFICVSLCFSLAVFGPPPFFPFLFLCLSLVILFLPSFQFFHLSFWFFLFLFVWFASWFKMLCCFSFSACCLLLFWIIMFDLFLLCILFSSSCCFWFLLLSYFVIFWILATYQKTSLKTLEIAKNPKMKNAQKRTFWQEQLAQVCSQIVSFFLFCVSLNFAFFAENTIKIGVSAKKKKKKHKKKQKT